jgi:hypothetical protein
VGDAIQHAVGGRLFLVDAELVEPAENDVEPAVGQAFHVRDEARAAHRVDRRPALVPFLVPGDDHRHADDAIALDRFRDQLPVARLEDVQRQEHPGKQHRRRQREERKVRGQHP